MERVRASEIATEGFRLVARRPVAVLVWGALITLVQSVIPTGLILWVMFSPGSEFRQALASGTGFEAETLQAFQLKANLLQWAIMPLSILVSTVVTSAALRSILEPEKRSYFSLRLGAVEGWLFVVGLVLFALIVIVSLPAIAVAAVIVVLLAMSSKLTATVVGILFGGAALAAYIWLGARFYLAMPLTFSARKFRLFDSWSLTKGHTWLIIRVYLVVLAYLFAAFIGLMILGAILTIPLVIAAVPLVQAMQDVDPTTWMMQNLGTVIGWAVALGLIFLAMSSFWSGAVMAIAAAPGARLFQSLAPSQDASPIAESSGLVEPATTA